MDENKNENADRVGETAAQGGAGEAPPPPPPARKRRRRWPWVILGIVLVLLLLVALAPAILSTGPAKSFVVGKVNDQLNGTLAIADWSIGWTSGVTIRGIKVDDEQGRRVMEIASVRVPMSLIGAARGNLDFGDTVINQPNLVNLEIYPDGSTNLDKLVKDTGDQAKPDDTGDGKLPDLKGKITVNRARATVTQIPPPGEPAQPPIHLDSGDVVVDIPDINGPITNDGRFVYRVGQSQPGTIAIAGTVDVIDDNAVNLEKLVADQKLTITSAELAAVEPFLQSPGGQTTLAGVASGALQLKANGLSAAAVDGQLNVANFAYGGDALKGDVYKSANVALPISVATTGSGGDTLIKIQTLKVETDHALVDVSGQANQRALQNLAAQKKPGSDGAVVVAVNTKDLPGLVNALRNTLGLQKDVQVTSGDVKARLDLTMTPDRAVVKQTLDASATGTNAGQPVKLDQVHLDAAVAAIPRGDGKLPDLRDIALNLTSAFAEVHGGGASLASLNITGNADLAKLRNQLGQFTDLGKLDLAGTADLSVTSKGDLTAPGGTSDVTANVNLTNLVVRGLEGQPDITEPRLALATTATLVRGPEGGEAIDRVKAATVTFQTGQPTAPVVDMHLVAQNVTLPKSPTTAPTAAAAATTQPALPAVERFELARLNIPDLARAQQQWSAFLPKDMNFAGSLTASAAGSYKDDTATFDALAVDTSQKYITLKKGAAPLVVQMKDAGVAGNGELSLASNLKSVVDLLGQSDQQLRGGTFSANVKLASQPNAPSTIALDGGVENLAIATNDKPIQNEKVALTVRANTPADFSAVNVESVVVDSSFARTTISETQIKLDADGVFDMIQRAKAQIAIPDLGRTYAVVQAFAPPATQPAAATPTARAAVGEHRPMPRFAIDGAAAAPVFAQVTGNERISRPKPAPAAAVPQQPAAPAPAAKAAPPAAPATTQPLEPLNIAGSAVLNLDLQRDGNVTRVNIPEITAEKLALTRGPRSYAFPKNVALKLAAELGTKKVPTTASTQPVDQVDQIRITQLGGDLGGLATLTAPENVVLTNLTGDQPSANGKVGVNGSLEPLTNLLAVIQGADPMPYRGDYAVAQHVRTDAGKIALTGNATVNKLVVLDAKGQPSFSEDKVVLDNDLVADTNAKTAVINRVALDMATSKALGLMLKGTLKDWERQRAFENVVVELPYDLAKVWEIVRPMLDAETQESLKDLKVAGQYKSVITVGGSYPATDASGNELAFNEAFKHVQASGDIGVPSFSYSGADIQNLVLPFHTDQGNVITLYANRPRDKRAAPPAAFNKGILDLNSILVDLTGDVPRVSIGKGQKLVANATINKFLGDSLGKFINPVFANATRAEGLLDVTAVSVEKLALGEALQTPQSGRATFTFSLNQMDIANPLGDLLMGGLLKQVGLGSQRAETQAFRGQIQNATISIDKGIVTEDIVMEIGKRAPEGAIGRDPNEAQLFPLGFSGTVRMSDLAQNLTVSIPSALFDSRDVERFFPQGVPVTLGGTTTNPRPDFGNFARRFVEAQAKSRLGDALGGDKQGDNPLGGALEGILGGRKPAPAPAPAPQQKGGTTTQPAPAPQPQKDPLGGLLDQLTRPKRDDSKRK